MKRNILFVDDEPNILQGLRRLLRPMRDKWDMHFVGSGQEALELMSRVSMDAVVSDMRMPGMDGPTLLLRIMHEHPDVVRFALSGYSDQEMIGRSIAPTHQYLTKPCDEEKLIQALEEAMNARAFISNKAVLDKIARIEHLPVLPRAYVRITDELSKGDPSPKLVGEIVAEDIGLTANILKLVNSSYFGLSRPVTMPQQAVIVLGVNVIRSVILSLHVFKSFETTEERSFSLSKLWAHCQRTASIARVIAQAEGLGKDKADNAYIAALLHDLGKLLLDAHCATECQMIYQEVRENNRLVAEVESEVLGLTHAQVGAYLLGLWGLPPEVVQAVARHHAQDPEPEGLNAASVTYFANLLDHDIFIFNEHYARPQASPERLAALGGPDTFARWREAAVALGISEEGT
ncbi:MAG: two-component system response regulator [Deltaproteobacteria bacterium HGW-Deltaproteobacteria-8]|jgi:putative nucleotidyltransferase with HDIG domain|nr:MAG: two-component system response regulator [Deltaproteobacteria bacterium HGW-Deltaproteobacteria-8]